MFFCTSDSVFFLKGIIFSNASSLWILKSRSGSFYSFICFCIKLLIVSCLSVSVTATTLESMLWLTDKPITAYSIVFLNFTFSTSFSSAILTVEILFLSVGYSLYNIWIGSIAYVGCNLIWPVAYIGCNLIWPVT